MPPEEDIGLLKRFQGRKMVKTACPCHLLTSTFQQSENTCSYNCINYEYQNHLTLTYFRNNISLLPFMPQSAWYNCRNSMIPGVGIVFIVDYGIYLLPSISYLTRDGEMLQIPIHFTIKNLPSQEHNTGIIRHDSIIRQKEAKSQAS